MRCATKSAAKRRPRLHQWQVGGRCNISLKPLPLRYNTSLKKPSSPSPKPTCTTQRESFTPKASIVANGSKLRSLSSSCSRWRASTSGLYSASFTKLSDCSARFLCRSRGPVACEASLGRLPELWAHAANTLNTYQQDLKSAPAYYGDAIII